VRALRVPVATSLLYLFVGPVFLMAAFRAFFGGWLPPTGVVIESWWEAVGVAVRGWGPPSAAAGLLVGSAAILLMRHRSWPSGLAWWLGIGALLGLTVGVLTAWAFFADSPNVARVLAWWCCAYALTGILAGCYACAEHRMLIHWRRRRTRGCSRQSTGDSKVGTLR
jgi:hypothetical protein